MLTDIWHHIAAFHHIGVLRRYKEGAIIPNYTLHQSAETITGKSIQTKTAKTAIYSQHYT